MPFALVQAVSAALRAAATDALAAGAGIPIFGFLATARQAKRDESIVTSIRQSARPSLHNLRLSPRALSSVSRIDSDHLPCSLRANAMPRKASRAGTTVPALGIQTRLLGPSNTTVPKRGRNCAPSVPIGSDQLPIVPHELLPRI